MPNRVKLVDIVNLNSKASCLSAERWMKALKGGTKSELYQILNEYVEGKSKITLGIIGSTLADIQAFNQESIELIKANPQVFELIMRPYVHSLSIFWSDKVFKSDVDFGKQIITNTFENIFPAYLPPEFVLRNSQLVRLKNNGIKTTFIHPNRVKSDLKSQIPQTPFIIKTIQDKKINCIPFHPQFDAYYLDTIQLLDQAGPFSPSDAVIYGWRDGESPFFLPDSVERERYFIQSSSKQFNRVFLKDVYQESPDRKTIVSYPQNSLLPWFSNFRLLWYINEVKLLEAISHNLSETKKALFLLLLNSDVLSSTEKNSISIRLNSLKEIGSIKKFTIKRQSRNLEAEEIMYLIENCSDKEILDYLKNNKSAFIQFTKAELAYLLQRED